MANIINLFYTNDQNTADLVGLDCVLEFLDEGIQIRTLEDSYLIPFSAIDHVGVDYYDNRLSVNTDDGQDYGFKPNHNVFGIRAFMLAVYELEYRIKCWNYGKPGSDCIEFDTAKHINRKDDDSEDTGFSWR